MSHAEAGGGKYFVLDASVWVSRLVPQDEFHEQVKSWLQKQLEESAQFISPTFMLTEVAGAISRRTGDPTLAMQVIHQLENLPGLRLVEMENELIHAATVLAAEFGLRGADSIYVALAGQLDLPLVTFDVDQGERAKQKVIIQLISK